ncbi:MAG TPA: luciferase family protein [Bacteroidota bacterium]|nr:luciferase family protein [Bacteroidota bacterium]
MGETSREIQNRVQEWENITLHPHRFGGVEFRLGRREIGHLHGDSLLDIPFPLKVRDNLIAERRVEPHHVLPQSGWISFRLRTPGDTEEAVRLLRLAYELAVDSATTRAAQATTIRKEQETA